MIIYHCPKCHIIILKIFIFCTIKELWSISRTTLIRTIIVIILNIYNIYIKYENIVSLCNY